MAIELTESERWDLLENNMIMRLATVNPHGLPHVLPIWYVTDREEEAIFFSTPEDSRKIRDLEETSKASLTVDEGTYYFDLRAVIANGDITTVEDEDLEARIERKWCQKYFDQDKRPEFMELLYKGRPWVWCRIDPTLWTSWDNSKIDLDKLRDAHD